MATDYYSQFLGRLNPLIKTEEQKASASMADKGLINSTAGQDYVASQRQKMIANAAELGENARQADQTYDLGNRTLAEQIAARQSSDALGKSTLAEQIAARQFSNDLSNRTLAEQISARQSSDTLGSKTLAEQTAARKQSNAISAQQSVWDWQKNSLDLSKKAKKKFKTTYSKGFKSALKGDPLEQQIGDPKEQQHSSTADKDVGYFDGMGYLTLKENKRQAQVNAALQAEQNRIAAQTAAANAEQAAWERAQAEKQNSTSVDPYSALTTLYGSQQDSNGKNKMLPSAMLNIVEGNTGFNFIAAAKEGDVKALSLVKLLYPLSWRSRIESSSLNTSSGKFPYSLHTGSNSSSALRVSPYLYQNS